MQFKKLTLDDIHIVRPYFDLVQSRTCDFSVGGMFMWRLFYDMEYCIADGCLISRLKDEQGNIYYNLPLCEDIEQALAMLETGGMPLRFCTIPEEYIPLFVRLYPNARIIEQPDYFDYLYNASDLIELRGGKYHGQRNQISQFMRQNPDWHFTDVHDLPIGQIIDFFMGLNQDGVESQGTAVAENRGVLDVLQNLDQYSMPGGVLLVRDKIVGFSFGTVRGDTLFVHIEKADRMYRGVYQMLNNQFAKRFGEEITYINREDDMGDLGLRRAKESYHPVSKLKKYVVEISQKP